MPLDPNIATMLQFIEGLGQPSLSQGSVEQARTGLRTLTVDLRDPATLAEVDSVAELTIAESIPARVYRPVGAATGSTIPTVVFFHGGGFVIGDLDTHDGICRLLAHDVGAVVVSVDYRLAPEHVFPAAVQDCYLALTWVAERVADFGGDPDKIVVGGDSAGGNLAAVCAQLAHADGLPLAAQLLVYPAVDLLGDYPSRTENAEGYFLTLADMEWFGRSYLGMDADDPAVAALAVDPRVAPLHAASLAGLPPAVVATAEFDPLRDEGNRYAELLADAGVTVSHQQFAGLIHGFYGMEQLSPAIADASAWINAALKDVLA
jgi:acetyl esterase